MRTNLALVNRVPLEDPKTDIATKIGISQLTAGITRSAHVYAVEHHISPTMS